jgi:hypothetical protein
MKGKMLLVVMVVGEQAKFENPLWGGDTCAG